MRGRGYTLVELVVGSGLGLLVMLLVTVVLVASFDFTFAVDAFQARELQLRATLDRMVAHAEQASDFTVYADYAAYQASSPVADGSNGACIEVEAPSSTAVYWRDASDRSLRMQMGGHTRALLGSVERFSASKHCPDKAWLHLEVSTESVGSSETTIHGTAAVMTRNYVYTENPTALDQLATLGVPLGLQDPADCAASEDPMTVVTD